MGSSTLPDLAWNEPKGRPWVGGGLNPYSEQRIPNSRHATLYALDGQTGKELWSSGHARAHCVDHRDRGVAGVRGVWSQVRGNPTEWPSAYGDAQHTSWIRIDAHISVESMGQPGFELQWKSTLRVRFGRASRSARGW